MRSVLILLVAVVALAQDSITPEGILSHIRVMSSDEFAGRGPGTPGEKRTVDYLVEQCRKIGLQPGNPNGTFIQSVPLWGVRSQGSVRLSAAGQEFPLTAGADYVAWSYQPVSRIDVKESPLVFVGYGIDAPEFQHNDYKGVDVKGATVVVLSGDPFGTTLTYYGRPATKYETAYAHGAVALITLYRSRTGSTDLSAMSRNFGRENMILRDAKSSMRLSAQVFLSMDKGKELLAASGQDLETLRKAAAGSDFQAVKLKSAITIHLDNTVRQIDSANVIAKIAGSDPKLRSEHVIYSGHWDHLGQDADRIYHGASDNAAGAAGVLELAEAFAKQSQPPRRSILFLWPTAEEKGLLGAKYYVEHPLYPLAKTVANLNLDYFSNWGWGRTHDFSIVGMGNSTLDDVVAEVVKKQNRVVTGDTAPEEGFYFRSDHWEFAKGGVPSIETSPGIEHIGKPSGFGAEKRSEYIRNDYHKVSDQIKSDWDLSGSVEDLQVLFEVGKRVANSDPRPTWKPNAPHRPLHH